MPRTSEGVGFRFDGERAGWSGLCQCGSVWACPVHAAKIGAERANDITQVTRYVIRERRGTVLHVTLTARHDGGMSLKKVLDGVTGAWEFVGRHRWWKNKLDADYGRLGFCRALEVTWGEAAGWHPHLHCLLFLDEQIGEDVAGQLEVLRIADRLGEVWAAGLARHGLTCSTDYGVKVRVATTDRDAETVLAHYVTKMAAEITRGDRKTARIGRYTPFELMAAAVETGDKRLLAVAHEYEQTMTGRRQLTWSGKRKGEPDIRTLAGLRDERTDEEIAESEDLASADAFFLSAFQWKRVVNHRIVIMETAERDGLAATLDMLDASGVRWELPAERQRRHEEEGFPDG